MIVNTMAREQLIDITNTLGSKPILYEKFSKTFFNK